MALLRPAAAAVERIVGSTHKNRCAQHRRTEILGSAPNKPTGLMSLPTGLIS